MIAELKTLLAVARHGTFAAAGASSGLTQAAVSARMQRLERRLGQPLFDRRGRNARLNDFGLETLARAEQLIRLFDGLGTGPDPRAGSGRILQLGAIASFQRGPLAEALADFHRAHPGLRTRVVPGLSLDLLDRIDAGALDLAVLIRPPFALPRDLHWQPLAAEPYRLLVPSRLRERAPELILASEPFIRYDRSSFGGRQVERFLRRSGLGVRELIEVDEIEALVRLVASGLGVALVPQTLGQARWPGRVRAVDLGEHTFHREIGLVHRQRPPADPLLLAMRDAISQTCRRWQGHRPRGAVRQAARVRPPVPRST